MQVTTVCLDHCPAGHCAAMSREGAEKIFQAHGIDEDGEVAFNRALRRAQILAFFGHLEPSTSAASLLDDPSVKNIAPIPSSPNKINGVMQLIQTNYFN